MKTENTIYDDMKEAFTEHTGLVIDNNVGGDEIEGVNFVVATPQSTEPTEPPPAPEVKPDPVAEEKKPDVAQEELAPEEQPSTWDHKRPPSSWTPKAREDWALIPEHLQREITRREENAANGARSLHTTYAPAKELMDNLHPFFEEVVQLGINPIDHVGSLLQTEKALRTADVPTKFNLLMEMADQFGVPLRDIVNQSVGADVIKSKPQAQQQAAAIPDEIRQELAEIRAWRAEQETAVVTSEVEQFGAQNEFFSDVRGVMADIIEKGLAQDLQTAYDMAIWSTPSVREVLLSRTSQPKSDPVLDRQTRAAKASVKSSGAIDVIVDDENDSIADTLRKQFNLSNGRV